MLALLLSLFAVCFAYRDGTPGITGPIEQRVPQEVLRNFGLIGSYGFKFPSPGNLTEYEDQIRKQFNILETGFKSSSLVLASPVSTTAKVTMMVIHRSIRHAVKWGAAHLLNAVYYVFADVANDLKDGAESAYEILAIFNRRNESYCSRIHSIERITQSKCTPVPLTDEQEEGLRLYIDMTNKLRIALVMVYELLNNNQLTPNHFQLIYAEWSTLEKMTAIQIIQDLWRSPYKQWKSVEEFSPLLFDVAEQLDVSVTDMNENIAYLIENEKNRLSIEHVQSIQKEDTHDRK